MVSAVKVQLSHPYSSMEVTRALYSLSLVGKLMSPPPTRYLKLDSVSGLGPFALISSVIGRPDMTFVVDWALKKQLSVYPK